MLEDAAQCDWEIHQINVKRALQEASTQGITETRRGWYVDS